MNPVKELEKHGQAVWLDFLARGFIAKGDLKRLIDTDGVKGVTSNPSIFEKAIGSSDEYDAPIGKALKRGDRPVGRLVRGGSRSRTSSTPPTCCARSMTRPRAATAMSASRFRPIWRWTPPATIAEARRLWKDVDRKNLMVKVPATPEGLPAIRDADRRRHQRQHHAAVLARRSTRRSPRPISPASKNMSPSGGDPSHVASVASFFVSRIDTVVDKQLDEKIAAANDPSEKERLAALKGKVAIANAKVAYQDYKRLFSGARWDKLAAKGAKPQRLLWASHRHEEQGLQRRPLCRGADRPRHRQHRAAGDARRVPRPRQAARQP